MLTPEFKYNYCPKFKELIDTYIRIQSEVLKLKFKDEMLYGEVESEEYYLKKVDYIVKKFKAIKSSDIRDCFDNINIFKLFEDNYTFW